MSLKESLDSYIIFHGPPFVGKSGYFTSELYETYKRISPNELFQMNSALSLRQLINNYIIKPLQEGKKVVVDDNMQTMAVRRSYTDTVLKKIPKIRCTCLTFRPEFGRTQLMWKREILLAEAVLHEEWQSLEKIFANDINVWYGRCEPVLDVEQLRKFEVTLPLQINSQHPFQIPCLMIECNAVSDATKIVGLMENWLRQNKRGRVIAIYESDRSNRIEVQKSVSEFLKFVQLSSGLVVFAYLVDVVSSGDLVLLTTSVLAFLMRLHCLDLFGSSSVYVYESLRHRKMAESVGMRHIKLARALTNPDLLRHGTIQFPIPKMLQSMRVVLSACETKEKDKGNNVHCVPLLEKAVESDNCIAKVSVGNHRTLYIAAQNVDTLHRYQQQLLEDPEPPPCTVNPSPSNAKPVFAVGRKKRLPSSSFKVLPSWMMRKRRKTADQTLRSVADDVASCSKIRRGQSRVQPSTVYIMTEEELRKTAKMILREGESSDDEKDTSVNRLLRDRKLVKEEKSEPEEEKIFDRKATRINEFDASEPRLANPRSRERVRHARTSKYSPRTPPQFNVSHRLSESSATNSTRKNAVISTEDSTDDDVCQMFFEGASVSKSRAPSKNYGPTDCSHGRELPKTLLKSALGKESPEAVCSSTQLQAISSSNCSENVTGGDDDDDDMNFLNEVLTGHASNIRPCLTNREVYEANTRSPSEKKSLKKSDSNIYQFFDSLIS